MTVTRWQYVKLLLLVGAIVTVLILGLAVAVMGALGGNYDVAQPEAGQSQPADLTVEERRDAIAAEPMLETTPEDATGGAPALDPAESISIPAVDEVGPAGIPSGFPHTPEGAAGQLAEVLVSVLSRMDVTHAQQVRAAWFENPNQDEQWPVLHIIQEFLRAGQMTNGLPTGASMHVTPVAAQIKGSDGEEWHVACVLLDVEFTYREVARTAYGHCERMTWNGDAWVIAAGAHPVLAPSTWPGTQLAIDAGWLEWKQE